MKRRLHDEPTARAEARAALSMGLTMTQWDELDEYDRAWPLALALADEEDAAGTCKACGGPASVCQDWRNQHAFDVHFRRCFRTAAILEAQQQRHDHEGVLTVAVFNPDKRKPATPE